MSILALDQAKKIIANSNIPSDRYDDADVQADIDVAEAQVAEKVGPLSTTTVTRYVWAGPLGAALPGIAGPITAVAGWSGDLSTLTIADGVITGLPAGRWAVTYSTGWTALPAPIQKAIEEQFRHVWSMRRGNTASRDAQPGAAHAMPYRVTELLAPYSGGSRP